MNIVALVLIVVASAFTIYFFLRRKAVSDVESEGASWPFHIQRPLTAQEQALHHRLVAALPGHIVLAQVPVTQVLSVNQGVDVQAWNDRVARVNFDFVVCAKDATVLAAIELEDPSRQTVERAEARQRRGLAAASAGLRVIHWQADALPDTAAIQAALAPGSPLLTTG